MNRLDKALSSIEPIDESLIKYYRNEWDKLLHPIGSLGELEELSIRISAMRDEKIEKLKKRAIVVMCSDNGIVKEDVTSSPQELTVKLTRAMLKGLTGVCALAKDADSEIIIVDMGMLEEIEDDRLIKRRIAPITKNFMKEPAMTIDEAIEAICSGIEIADKLYKEYDILGTGELGMGNTTTSAAVISAALNLDEKLIVGLGSGVSDEQYQKKLSVVKNAIKKYELNKKEPIEILATVGGFDIAGLVGIFISAAKNKKPVVIDGLISSAAALIAYKLNNNCKDYMIASHLSKESGEKYVLDELKLLPMLDLNMRLGEGSGCPLAFKILDSSFFALNNMGTYKENEVEENILVNIRDR
ncbi:MAG: nicotinate-nucleotide--dimethylbenzimidazole phosphoribosyltransferase [Tissierellia bacterium]|nr:nicotinate-nucleotide--dimethylbenzimidazole phosphoribosyltransferase [Tissierellia bacterium]